LNNPSIITLFFYSIIIVIVNVIVNVVIIGLVIQIIYSLYVGSTIDCYYILFDRFYLFQQWIYFIKKFSSFSCGNGRLTNISLHMSTLIVQTLDAILLCYTSYWLYLSYIFIYSLVFNRSWLIHIHHIHHIHPRVFLARLFDEYYLADLIILN
jgi:hypothetical protein